MTFHRLDRSLATAGGRAGGNRFGVDKLPGPAVLGRGDLVVAVFGKAFPQVLSMSDVESARSRAAQDVDVERLAGRLWWAWVELNYRPHPYQGCALAT